VSLKVFGVDAAAYRAHELHRTERVWVETNCYVDLWIELLHTMGLDPVASMAFTLAMDFEGDQWTFFKQPAADLYRLYGVDVQELTIWRPVALHVAEQVARGRIPLVEVDSFHLPDTAGVAYEIEHTKTTVAVEAIDLLNRRMGYFHNAGYFELNGTDFDGIFDSQVCSLAPYTEIAKLDRVVRRSDDELTSIAESLTRDYVARIPRDNPVARYRARYAADIEWLAGEDMAVFYKYAFATLRQCGACSEMASTFLAWLAARGGPQSTAIADFAGIASAAKAVQFKIARMMATKKPVDVAPLFDQMESGWDRAMADLTARYAT
jgi:hypothetical protein